MTCGACVNQCPVDIEHVDHIIDMRRYQVLVEANFPAELNQLFKGMENKGNPWNMSSSARMDWAKDLPFDVKVVGEDVESLDEVEWLFWVGCAGAYEDRQKKTTRAVAELLDMAGVSFAVLGNGETCTGDQARRAGNEFLFQQLAAQNSETFKEFKVKKVVSTCAHCFNTLKNEYADFGVELEVIHHTQLLNRLVREGRLTPVADGAGASKRSITYHDPCYIGRHNGVYSPPRELLQVLPGAEFVEMERNCEQSFCCGAGGARMWMEENIGERINVNRTNEAVGTGADQIAVGCPFCRVMLSDGLTAAQAKGTAREEVEVLDVAQMLLASVKGESAVKVRVASGGGGAATAVETKAEPEAGDVSGDDEVVDQRGTSVVEPPRSPAAARCSTSVATTTWSRRSPPTPAARCSTSVATTARWSSRSRQARPPMSSRPPASPTAARCSTSVATTARWSSSEERASSSPPTSPTAARSSTSRPTRSRLRREGRARAGSQSDPPAVEPSRPPQRRTGTAPPTADLGSGGSLFDIAAPEVVDASADDEPEAESEAEPEPEPDEQSRRGRARARGRPEAEEKPNPATSGEANQPKTDVDISGSSSLFDL